MRAVFALLALAISACFAQNCKTTTDCGPGTKCDGGECKVRPECPQYTPPVLKPGCKLETVLDEKGCPKFKQVNKSNCVTMYTVNTVQIQVQQR